MDCCSGCRGFEPLSGTLPFGVMKNSNQLHGDCFMMEDYYAEDRGFEPVSGTPPFVDMKISN